MKRIFTWSILLTSSVPYFHPILKADSSIKSNEEIEFIQKAPLQELSSTKLTRGEGLAIQNLHVGPLTIHVQEPSTKSQKKTSNSDSIENLSHDDWTILKESVKIHEKLSNSDLAPLGKLSSADWTVLKESVKIHKKLLVSEPTPLEATHSPDWIVLKESVEPPPEIETASAVILEDSIDIQNHLLVSDSIIPEPILLEEPSLQPLEIETASAVILEDSEDSSCSQPDILFFLDQEISNDSIIQIEPAAEKIEENKSNKEIYTASTKNKKDDKKKKNIFANIAIGIASAAVIVLSAILGSN